MMARLGGLLLVLAVPFPTAAQWVQPKPPCDVKPGHFRVNSAVVNLSTAAEKPTQRDRMLRQTLDVLTRALIQDKQDENPGAWYYLGRYYVEMKDGAGADTAFARAEKLAPQCAADITGYRTMLAADLQTDGLRVWQEGKNDSAVTILRQASRLAPTNPKPLLTLGQVFASQDNLDSAAAYLRRGAAVAASDPSLATERREALGTITRQYLRRTQSHAAVRQAARSRFSRDSLERVIANDSLILTRLVASAASRRARGARLAPGDQQTFSRDSAARAQALASGQAVRGGLVARVQADSAAAQPILVPAIAAYREYLAVYPDDIESVSALATLYGQSGRAAEARATFDSIYGASDAATQIEVGRRVLRANLPAAGTAVLARGLERLPNHRDGLYELATGYRLLRDTTRLLATAQRLVGVDPLNRDALRLLATAWEARGPRGADSARYYAAQADSGLKLDVTVTSFGPGTNGFILTAIVNNAGATASSPRSLIFEFYDAQGALQTSQTVTLPAIPPRTSQEIEVRAPGTGLSGWRYRPS